jgi:predicted ATP-binding protein involved in virulence
MNTAGTLRLDRLKLTNFRCFTECEIDLHPKLTVLVAENGRGKTALLDAIGIALALFVDTLAGLGQSHGFERSDVHRARGADGKTEPKLPVKLAARGTFEGETLRWSRERSSTEKGKRTTTGSARKLRKVALGLRARLAAFAGGDSFEAPVLPVVAFYGTGRLWSEHRLTSIKKAPPPSTMARVTGYFDGLSSSSSFRTFADWYEATAGAAKSPAGRAFGQDERPERLLAAVRQATRLMLEPTGWRDLDWDFEQRMLVAEHPQHGRLPLSVLSDGVRNMIALVADLAHRCVRLNPQLGEDAAARTPGILLIDEVDMHLHPRWQQLVVDLLRRTFPAMQMVLSTHSPHVLSTVDVESIRVLRVEDGRGVFHTPTFQTRGVESADVLAAIMGVDPVPQVEQARWLSRYRAMIEDGLAETAEAQALRADLVAHFGAQHPVMLDCDRLLRFQAFKLRRAAPRQEG